MTRAMEMVLKDTIPDSVKEVIMSKIFMKISPIIISTLIKVGKRVATVDGNLPAQLITRYDSYFVINKDQKNLLKVGRTWVEDTPFSNEKTITLTTNSPIQANDVVRYRTQVVAYNSQQNTVDFKINNLHPHPVANYSYRYANLSVYFFIL